VNRRNLSRPRATEIIDSGVDVLKPRFQYAGAAIIPVAVVCALIALFNWLDRHA
jgi:hypothetical protein